MKLVLSVEEVQQLQAASRTLKEPQSWKYDGRAIYLDIELPPQAVAAITVEFTPTKTDGDMQP